MNRKEWKMEVLNCRYADDGHHNYIVTSKMNPPNSEHATEMLCTICMLRVNVADIQDEFPLVRRPTSE